MIEADIEAALAQEIDAEQEKSESEEPEEPEEPEEAFEVHEDNWQNWLFFLRVQTQWVYQGMDGRLVGLNNTAVEATMRMTGVKRKDQDALLAGLQVMEREVLKVDGERAAKAGG